MLPEFGLLNMNGRLYDSAVGRMLSPDNFSGYDGTSQSFIRYSYAYNNPLKYTDPTGEFNSTVAIAGAAIGFVAGSFYTAFTGGDGGDWLRNSLIGAGIGALGGGFGQDIIGNINFNTNSAQAGRSITSNTRGGVQSIAAVQSIEAITPETAWDIINVVMGFTSLAANVASGNIFGAAVDGLGLINDGAANVAPVVPGGASTIIQAYRFKKVTDNIVGAINKVGKINYIKGSEHLTSLTSKAQNSLSGHLKLSDISRCS